MERILKEVAGIDVAQKRISGFIGQDVPELGY